VKSIGRGSRRAPVPSSEDDDLSLLYHTVFQQNANLALCDCHSDFHVRCASKAWPLGCSIACEFGWAKKTSVALCHQVTTLDRAKLEKPIGVLPRDVMQQVDSGLKAALNLI